MYSKYKAHVLEVQSPCTRSRKPMYWSRIALTATTGDKEKCGPYTRKIRTAVILLSNQKQDVFSRNNRFYFLLKTVLLLIYHFTFYILRSLPVSSEVRASSAAAATAVACACRAARPTRI